MHIQPFAVDSAASCGAIGGDSAFRYREQRQISSSATGVIITGVKAARMTLSDNGGAVMVTAKSYNNLNRLVPISNLKSDSTPVSYLACTCNRFDEAGDATFLLKRMEGRQVQLPGKRDFWPDKMHLAWHRERKFRALECSLVGGDSQASAGLQGGIDDTRMRGGG